MSEQVDSSPKAFISYSWTSPEHEAWVIDLATQLEESGVHVILDKWNLKEGADKYVCIPSARQLDTLKIVSAWDTLLVFERDYWIHLRCLSRRQVTGQHRHDSQEQRDSDERRRIQRAYAEQQAGNDF